MSKEQKLTSNEQKVTSNEQKATSNEQKATSNEQKVTSNQQKVTATSNEQKVQPHSTATAVLCSSLLIKVFKSLSRTENVVSSAKLHT